MFVHANKKRSAKSFPREYYRDKTKKVNTRAEGDDATVGEDDEVTSTIRQSPGKPKFKTPVESVRASRKGSSSDTQSEAGTVKPTPSILPRGGG